MQNVLQLPPLSPTQTHGQSRYKIVQKTFWANMSFFSSCDLTTIRLEQFCNDFTRVFELETKEGAVARVAHFYYIMMNLRLVRKLLLINNNNNDNNNNNNNNDNNTFKKFLFFSRHNFANLRRFGRSTPTFVKQEMLKKSR